jgi:hypothetical protein
MEDFGRLRNGDLKDNEEVRFDTPTVASSSFSYVGSAVHGSATSDTAWSIIRVTFDNRGRKVREQFRTNVSWDDRTIGWL